MTPASAYFSAVLVASILVGQELIVVDWVLRRLAGLKVDSLWIGMAGVAMMFTPIILLAALVISIIPFLIFYPLYKRQPEHLRLPLAMVFGSVLAFGGLHLALGLLNRINPPDIGTVMLLSLLPGIASGWVFHKVMPRAVPASGSPAERKSQEQLS